MSRPRPTSCSTRPRIHGSPSTSRTRSSWRASRRSAGAWPTSPRPRSGSSCRPPSSSSRRDKLQQQAKAALTQGNEDLAREALARRAALAEQLTDLQTQHEQVAAQEAKLIATAQKLQTQVDSFRTKKETMKATYTAAEAQTKIGEAVSGISESMSDAGMSMQRAQDKIDGMQARAGAMDELLASGALTDLSNPVDDIQAQLNKASTTSTVDAELAALKAEVGHRRAASGRARMRPDSRGHPVVIVRILGEGQYQIPDDQRGVARRAGLDAVADAVDSGDETAFDRRPGRADRRGPPARRAAGRRRLRPLRPGGPLPRRHPGRDQGAARPSPRTARRAEDR